MANKYKMNLRIVDVNKALRNMIKSDEFLGRDISGPDYRFEIDTPTGGVVTFSQQASALWVMNYMDREGWVGGVQLG